MSGNSIDTAITCPKFVPEVGTNSTAEINVYSADRRGIAFIMGDYTRTANSTCSLTPEKCISAQICA